MNIKNSLTLLFLLSTFAQALTPEPMSIRPELFIAQNKLPMNKLNCYGECEKGGGIWTEKAFLHDPTSDCYDNHACDGQPSYWNCVCRR